MAKVMRTTSMVKCIGCYSCVLVCAAVNERSHSFQKSRIKIRAYGGYSSTFSDTYCAGCREPACAEVCPTDALVYRKGGGVTVKKDKCIGCRVCIKACVIGAIDFDDDKQLPLICRHCGVCAQYCPHGIFVMEDVED